MQSQKGLPEPSSGLVKPSSSQSSPSRIKPQSLLIIGNGGAAIHAIQAIRAAGYKGPPHLVSDTTGPAFNPMLSPYYLAGEISLEQCFPFGQHFYETNSVICHFGSPAEGLDAVDRKVYLKGGESISYDRCLVATGASSDLPPAPGLRDSQYVFMLRTAEQMIRLYRALSGVRKAVILGASLLGIQLAEILIRRGIKVTLVDLTTQILPFTAHFKLAPILHQHLIKCGVDLRLGWVLRWVEYVQDWVHLHFQDDQILKADMVLVCTGVKPNIEFLKDTEIEIDQGILVDDHMQTSVNDIYAAGDVSQGMNPVRNFSSVRVDTDGALNPAAKQRGTLSNGVNQLSGKRERIGLWGNACYQGRTAGLNKAGMDPSYPGFLQQHIPAFFGLTFVHLGDINPQDKEIETLENFNHSESTFRLLVFDRGVLIGANLINCHEEAGWLKTDMIRAMAQLKNRDRYIFYPSGKEVEV